MTRTKIHPFNVAMIALIIAGLLFSLGSPVLKLLIERGGPLGFTHPDAISFCNVLFVGNFCAGLVSLLIFNKAEMFKSLRNLSKNAKYLLFISCILAVIYPSFVFIALEKTSVTRIVLLSRFEGIFYAILAFFILKNRLNKSEIFGYSIIAIGVIVILFSQGMVINTGDILVLSACVVYGLSEIVSYYLLESISLHAFIFARNLFSAILFFIIATYLFGPMHFAEAFYGDLWILMIIYAGLLIVLGQILWYYGMKRVDHVWPTNIALMSPFFTIFFAYLLLQEVPDPMEWIAIIAIAVGVIFSRVGPRLKRPKGRVITMDSGLVAR